VQFSTPKDVILNTVLYYNYCNNNVISRHLASARLWCVCVFFYLFLNLVYISVCSVSTSTCDMIFGE